MSEEKSYTIKEIADKLHVSKSAIQQKLTDDFKKKFVSKKIIGGRSTQIVSETGFLELKKKTRVKKTIQNKNDNDDNVVEILKQQLKKKDEQIEKLQILLNQSQQLQLQQDEKIKLLETKKKHWWQKLFQQMLLFNIYFFLKF